VLVQVLVQEHSQC